MLDHWRCNQFRTLTASPAASLWTVAVIGAFHQSTGFANTDLECTRMPQVQNSKQDSDEASDDLFQARIALAKSLLRASKQLKARMKVKALGKIHPQMEEVAIPRVIT